MLGGAGATRSGGFNPYPLWETFLQKGRRRKVRTGPAVQAGRPLPARQHRQRLLLAEGLRAGEGVLSPLPQGRESGLADLAAGRRGAEALRGGAVHAGALKNRQRNGRAGLRIGQGVKANTEESKLLLIVTWLCVNTFSRVQNLTLPDISNHPVLHRVPVQPLTIGHGNSLHSEYTCFVLVEIQKKLIL